jgi:hypothetical protein
VPQIDRAVVQVGRLTHAAGEGGGLRLRRYEIELARLALRPREMRRGGSVTFHHRNLVQETSRRRRFDAQPDRFLRGLLGVLVAPERAIRERQIRKRERMAGAAPQRLLRLADGEVVPAEAIVDQRQRIGRPEIARIGRLPDLQRSRRLVLVAGDPIVVLIRDEEALSLADAPLDVVGETRELLAPTPLADAAVDG